jgi:hypothetical protein
VVVSGYDDPVIRAEAARYGAAYCVKPASAATLLAELQTQPTAARAV